MRKLYLILLLPIFWLTSCNDFLDVSADNELLQKEIFGDYKGVRMAVNGVYRSLSSTSLYGQNLTWGFASAIGHNYQSTSQYYGLYEVASFDWENASAQSLTESIWSKGYNVIASCNDIIQQVISKDTSFFGEGKMEKDMILGEMYGVRALVHFDLFRLFCPAPVTQNTGRAIPYVTRYPDLQPSYQNAPAFMDSVIMDMTRAQSLLAVVDTVFNRRQNTSIYSRVRSDGRGLVDAPDDFFLYRATRMNYFAANALLARMYLYNGDEENAYKNARLAYDFHLRWFRWTGSSYQGGVSNINFLYPKRYNELFLCFSNNDVVDDYQYDDGDDDRYDDDQYGNDDDNPSYEKDISNDGNKSDYTDGLAEEYERKGFIVSKDGYTYDRCTDTAATYLRTKYGYRFDDSETLVVMKPSNLSTYYVVGLTTGGKLFTVSILHMDDGTWGVITAKVES